MALNSREVAAGALSLFLAWAIAAQWLPSIRLVPFAFAAGLIAAAAAALLATLTAVRSHAQAQRQPFPPTSSLGFTAQQSWASEVAAAKRRARYTSQAMLPASPRLSEALDEVLGLVLRDFLRSWYGKISPGAMFVNEVDRVARIAIKALVAQLAGTDVVNVFVIDIVPVLHTHLQHASEASRAVRGRNAAAGMTDGDEFDIAVAAKYRDGHMHAAASLAATKSKGPQQKHLRHVVAAMLPQLLPDNMTTSQSVMVLVREIVACAVLLPVMQVLSDADTINQMIEAYGRSVLHDRKTVKKLRAALDEHASPKSRKQPAGVLRLAADDNERSFEKFVRVIRQCSNLADARRFSNEVSRQVTRERASPNANAIYIRRLELGQKLLDQKVAQLSQPTMARSASASQLVEASSDQRLARENASLGQVLYDATGLSYFMEYMDRQKLMVWVQFWIVVDGMHGPLVGEYDADDVSSKSSIQWTDSDRQDLKRIYEAYLQRPEMRTAQDAAEAVSSFLAAGPSATNAQFSQARRAVFRAQNIFFSQMEKGYFVDFKTSDLFYRWVASGKDQRSVPSAKLTHGHDDGTESSAKNVMSRAPAISRLQSDSKIHRASETGHLRRAVVSSSNLSGGAAQPEAANGMRRSLDEGQIRAPLFDDDPDYEPLADSVQSLDSAGSNALNEEMAVSAVQATLDELIEAQPEPEKPFSERQGLFADEDSDRGSADVPSATAPLPVGPAGPVMEKGKPSLSSLGLLGSPSRRTVFSEGDLFGESEQMWEEERADASNKEETGDEADEIREAAPGDLGLAELIQSLSGEIDKLEAQQSIVDSLVAKAELTNNAAELRILRKSKQSLGREIRRKELQRQQYIIQESDNTLYGKASISIKNVMVGTEPDGHEFALYVVEVQRTTTETAAGASWAITRRYSEFYELYKRLRRRFPALRDVDFPRRQVVLTLQKDFLRKRRVALERFLGELLTSPAVCKSLEFRAFLSQQTIRVPETGQGPGQGHEIDRQDFVSRIYNSVTDGMEEFLGNVPVLDQLSLAGQSLISAATSASTVAAANTASVTATQARRSQDGGAVLAGLEQEPETIEEAQAELKAFEAAAAAVTPAQQQTTKFITPLADAFIQVFQLHTGNAWLRGRAVVVILQQLLGGTVERKVRESYRNATTEEAVTGYVALARDMLWPDGRLRAPPAARSAEEKLKSRKEATAVLATLLPDLAGGVVGRSNASAAGRRIAATLNNERLNAHLAYTVLDRIAQQVFGVSARD